MGIMLLNASPRRSGNTAQMMRAAEQGAKSAGADTEYIDLYELKFGGCRSCMTCKRKGVQRCRCYWKDDLTPVLDRVFAADALLIGSPVYLGNASSGFYAFLERLRFSSLNYDDFSSYFEKRTNVGIILTMNVSEEIYHSLYEEKMKQLGGIFHRAIRGDVRILASCDTLQVDDYSLYSMAGFDEEYKKNVHRDQFPVDLENAFELGRSIIE